MRGPRAAHSRNRAGKPTRRSRAHHEQRRFRRHSRKAHETPGAGMSETIPSDALGAFCRHTHVALSATRLGPLTRLNFGAKDIYDVAGHKTGFGSPDWLRTHGPAAQTAPIVQQLLDAGANMVGKTHTDELTFSLNGENAHYGTPVNVNAPGRIPGG